MGKKDSLSFVKDDEKSIYKFAKLILGGSLKFKSKMQLRSGNETRYFNYLIPMLTGQNATF
jgi:hypothetical protein